jgi:hypothetical protein
MKSIFRFVWIAAIPAVLFFMSCAKDNSSSGISNEDLALAQDEVYANNLYEEVDNLVLSNVAGLEAVGYSPMSVKSTENDGNDCMIVIVDHPDSIGFPKVVTLDFGAGCTRIYKQDTLNMAGKIHITITEHWFVPGSQHIVTFDNFFINGIQLEGTRTIVNKGLNEKNHPVIEVILKDGKMIFNDTTFLTRESDHMREWIIGNTPLTDTILVTGSASGINVKGEQYERLITSPLVMVRCHEAQWKWVIVSGTMQITNSTSGVSTIDYSGKGCDGSVVIRKNGNEYHMPFQYKYHGRHKGHNH